MYEARRILVDINVLEAFFRKSKGARQAAHPGARNHDAQVRSLVVGHVC